MKIPQIQIDHADILTHPEKCPWRIPDGKAHLVTHSWLYAFMFFLIRKSDSVVSQIFDPHIIIKQMIFTHSNFCNTVIALRIIVFKQINPCPVNLSRIRTPLSIPVQFPIFHRIIITFGNIHHRHIFFHRFYSNIHRCRNLKILCKVPKLHILASDCSKYRHLSMKNELRFISLNCQMINVFHQNTYFFILVLLIGPHRIGNI